VTFLLWVLAIVGVPFALRLKSRIDALEADSARQRDEINSLSERLRRRLKEESGAAEPTAKPAAPAAPPSVAAPPAGAPPSDVPLRERPAPVRPSIPRPPHEAAPPRMPAVPPPVPPPIPPVPAVPRSRVEPPPPPAPGPPPPPPEPAWTMPRISIDWEDLVGVKLFSAVAGIALLLAAIFFLRYSIDHGWLQPPVRVAIGVIVGTALLVVCELKAARKYRVTANALDASAIAILFSTFFAAHALWDLIPNLVTFGLLILVTALAVLLSIRHDSRFIAVLGLLGGFATPALLSTGENRPIPLFTYLLLLNAGLAWVAFKKGWQLLTILTLVFTAIYQWGWVVRFLDASQLSLAMGVFLVFSIMSFVALTLGRRGAKTSDAGGDSQASLVLERTGLAASLMPLLFAVYLAAVPGFGAHATLLFGFLFIVDVGLLAVAIARREEMLHVVGGLASLLVFATWLAMSYASSAWITATIVAALCVGLYALAPLIAERVRKPFEGIGAQAVYTAPLLLFIFPVIARIEPATASPAVLFGILFALLALLAWRALATPDAKLFFIAAFFGLAAEASWSGTHLVTERLGTAIILYALFGLFYLGVPIAARRSGRSLEPRWGAGAVVIASLVLLLFLAAGPRAAAGLWGMAFLLALLNAGLFVESAAGRLPLLSAIGSLLSWIVLGVWWGNAAAVVGVMPSLIVLVGLTLVMLGGHAWAYAESRKHGDLSEPSGIGFPTTTGLGLVGHGFLFLVFQNPEWSTPPWPALGALFVMTLAVSTTSLFVRNGVLHAAGTTAAAIIVLGWAVASLGNTWATVALAIAEVVIAYALIWLRLSRRLEGQAASIGAALALFAGELTLIAVSSIETPPPFAVVTLAHVVNVSLILWLAWIRQWPWVSSATVAPAWFATISWSDQHPEPSAWLQVLRLSASLYAVLVAYPFVLGRRAREARDPYLTAIVGSVFFLFAARSAFMQGGYSSYVGIVPVFEGLVMALLLRALLRMERTGDRDLARLAVVAATSLAFATVAIPLQLKQQWITIGWALEGAALAWLYRRIPHRGLLYSATALLSVVFVRLALNPAVFVYQPRGMRVFNWYLYAYAICAVAMFVASWWFARTEDELFEIGDKPIAASTLFPPCGVILLFLLLNIEIADFYATGPEITFRFGVTIAQDLTYTVGWLLFGLALLAAGIYLHNRPGRMTAVALIAVTMFKAFLYDMGSLGGLYRVASLVGLAVSLALVALALQKFVLQAPKETS